ncbi:MAG: hypothetical protein Q8P22_13490, partial [Chloroflexota bacterium]|nr:hypothetical protein [Chloroflexota bacterium]
PDIAGYLAANYFDDLIGEPIWEVERRLGEDEFERLLILGLRAYNIRDIVEVGEPDAQAVSNAIGLLVRRAAIAELLGLRGGDDAVQPLATDLVYHCPADIDSRISRCALECRVEAMFALAGICNKKAVDALAAIAFTEDACWDCVLLASMGLVIARHVQVEKNVSIAIPDPGIATTACWCKAGGTTFLGFLSDVRMSGGIHVIPGWSWDPGQFVKGVPSSELREAARELLHESWPEQELALSLFAEYGTRDDLPLLRTKLENESRAGLVHGAIERIQRRTQ